MEITRKEEIEKFCREFEIINYIINDDFSIDENGLISRKDVEEDI